MKTVLLTLEKPSKLFIDDFKEYIGGPPPYAIILLESKLKETYTIEPCPKEIAMKEANKTVSKHDRVPKTHYTYNRSCIIFQTEDDYKNDAGVYWEFIPDYLEDDLYEYNAKLLEL
jgi:hypothetical protein